VGHAARTVGFLCAGIALLSIAAAAPRPPLDWSLHAIATTRPAAQRAFDEGLTYYYAYAPQDAVLRFVAAEKADPQSAMAHYGAALAYGPNINEEYDLANAAKARAELVRAHALAGGARAEERGLIAALDARYTPTTQAQIGPAQTAYATAMDALANAYPRDADAQTLAADAWMDTQPWGYWENGKPLGHTLRIIELLDRALAIDPQNIGANHFLIHAYEESDTPGKALEAGRRLAAMNLAPACEHLVHMPSHVEVRTGHWADAIRANEAALAHFREYLAGPHASGHEGYVYHDAAMLLYAAVMAGDYPQALAIAQRVAREQPAYFADATLEVDEAYEKWPEIAASPASLGGAYAQSARGEADAALGKLPAARTIAAALAAAAEAHGDDKAYRIRALLVAAKIAEATGDEATALADLEKAVAVQDAMGYMEPPGFVFPVRERLGETLLGLGRTGEARRVFDADLVRTPGNPRSLAGLSAIAATPSPATDALRAALPSASPSTAPTSSASPSPR
jgi:tetratricopeptide (TPR) repeat protein